jgi:hypothetical protein
MTILKPSYFPIVLYVLRCFETFYNCLNCFKAFCFSTICYITFKTNFVFDYTDILKLVDYSIKIVRPFMRLGNPLSFLSRFSVFNHDLVHVLCILSKNESSTPCEIFLILC